MRYTFTITDESGKASTIEAMSYKKMLKKLDSKKKVWVTYVNKHGNALTKVIEKGVWKKLYS